MCLDEDIKQKLANFNLVLVFNGPTADFKFLINKGCLFPQKICDQEFYNQLDRTAWIP